jgi:ElaA protein
MDKIENRVSTWKVKHFKELSTWELYSIMQLRLAVFSVEQNCPYQDADDKDQAAFHVTGFDAKGKLAAYARVLPAGISYPEVSIGRVVTSKAVRSTGAGKELMKRSLEFIQKEFGNVPVRIGAQCYLKKFYGDFGFVPEGEEYLEDNIPHVIMLRKA